MSDQHKVFVYGTTRRGGRYHEIVSGSELLDENVQLAGAVMFDLGPYPALVPAPEGTTEANIVTGELYSLDDATLAQLDSRQDHPYLYQRQEVTVTTSDGHTETAWVYWYRHSTEDAERVADGDYAPRL